VLAAAVVPVAGLPSDGAAQDTARAAMKGWIGIRFNLETREAPGLGQGSYALVVRDVYGNGPADQVGIRPGDWFVAVNGNTLSTVEAWQRSTSGLGPGHTLTVRLLRDTGEQEVAVVAGRRPRSLPPHPLYRLEWDMARARFDSLFDLFLKSAPRLEHWPALELPHISWPEGFALDSATLRMTINHEGLEAEGSVFVAPGDQTRMSRRRKGPPDPWRRVVNPVGQQVRTRSATSPEAAPEGRGRTQAEQRRRDEREPGRGAGLEGSPSRSASEAFAPVGAVGGSGPNRMYGTARVSVLAPQLLAGSVTVVLGGAVVRDLTPELGRYFGVASGVLVTDVVDARTPAAQAGFRPGDIIVSVEDRRVESLPAFRRVLAEEHPPIEITVVRRQTALKLAYPSR